MSHSDSDAEQRGHLEVPVVAVGQYGDGRRDDVAQRLHGRQAPDAQAHGGRDDGRPDAGERVHRLPDAAPRVDAGQRERGGVRARHDVVHGGVLARPQVALDPVLDQREHEQADEPDGHGRDGAPGPVPGHHVQVHQLPRDAPVRDHHGRDDGRGQGGVDGREQRRAVAQRAPHGRHGRRHAAVGVAAGVSARGCCGAAGVARAAGRRARASAADCWLTGAAALSAVARRRHVITDDGGGRGAAMLLAAAAACASGVGRGVVVRHGCRRGRAAVSCDWHGVGSFGRSGPVCRSDGRSVGPVRSVGRSAGRSVRARL